MASRVALLAIGLATTVAVARVLGPDGRGAFAIAAATTAIGIQIGNLGFHAANTRHAAQQKDDLGGLVANSLLISVVVGGTIGLIVWLVGTISPQLAVVDSLSLALAAVGIPVGLAYLLLQHLLLGIGRIGTYNKLDLMTRLILVGALAAAIWARALSVPIALAATLAGVLVGGLVAAVRLRRESSDRVALRPDLIRRMLGFGSKAYLAALLSFLVLRADLLLVGWIRGSADAGYYSIAVALGDLVYLLPVVVGTLLFARLSAIPDDRTRRGLIRLSARTLAPLMTIFCVIAAFVAGWAVSILYGPTFEPSVDPFRWLLPGILALSIYSLLANYFAASGMPLVAIAAPFGGLVVSVVLDLALIPPYGALGAAVAASIGYVAMLAIGIVGYLDIGRPRDGLPARAI
jgi:O-antigen/teichoic acid export membrane protein